MDKCSRAIHFLPIEIEVRLAGSKVLRGIYFQMVVGIGTMTFRLHDCHSLKGKRRVVKSIVAQLRNHFNASVAEVDANDAYHKAIIGVAMVGNRTAVINSKLDKLINLAEDLGLAEMIDSEMEIIHL
jgi:uncharacterized protein YlxP (DUF503 family)